MHALLGKVYDFRSNPLKRTKDQEIDICWEEKEKLDLIQYESDLEKAREFWARQKKMAELRMKRAKAKRAKELFEKAMKLRRALNRAKEEYSTTEIGRGGRLLWKIVCIHETLMRAEIRAGLLSEEEYYTIRIAA